MSNKRMKRKVIRCVGGAAFTVAFIIFAVISCKVAVHSDLCFPNCERNSYNDTYGYDREKFLETQPEGTMSSIDMKLGKASEEKRNEIIASIEEDAQPEATPDVEATPEVLSKAAQNAQEKGYTTPPEIDISEWQYVLVNRDSTVDSSFYQPETAFFTKNVTATDEYYVQAEPDLQDWNHCQVDSRIAEALMQMSKDCVAAGNPVYLSSGYRSYSEQEYLLNQKMQSYSYEEAIKIVTPPGTSEHQTGLCADITDKYYEGTKNESLEQTATFQWLKEHCTEYGFIVRYPKDKKDITNIMYEPWHFRYVGVEVAKYMEANNICLEEFCALYE